MEWDAYAPFANKPMDRITAPDAAAALAAARVKWGFGAVERVEAVKVKKRDKAPETPPAPIAGAAPEIPQHLWPQNRRRPYEAATVQIFRDEKQQLVLDLGEARERFHDDPQYRSVAALLRHAWADMRKRLGKPPYQYKPPES